MESRELSPLEYNALLKNLSQSGDLISAANYFNEMKRRNIEIKGPTLFHLIESSGSAGELPQMMNYFDELKSKNREIPLLLYEKMTAACLSKNNIPLAFAILDMFFDELDFMQGKFVLIRFLRHFLVTNNVRLMESIFQKFKATGKFKFTADVYALMCRAHAAIGNLAMMEKYLDDYKKCGDVHEFFKGYFILKAYVEYGSPEDVQKAHFKLQNEFGISRELLNKYLLNMGSVTSESKN
jgi:pentatricopeptide repeat protein